MQRIIINADDFGINDIVTSEIKKMIELKVISSTTIMANGKSLEKVKEIVSEHPEISFGVHLCMDEFDSLTRSDIFFKYGIIDIDGQFIKNAIFKIKQFPSELKDAIKDELSAQIETLLNIGITPSHADSHHHFHTIYQLKDIISEVLDQYNIKKIRRGVNPSLFALLNRFKAKNNEVNNIKEKVNISQKKQRNIVMRSVSLFQSNYYIVKLNKFYSKKYIVTDLFESYSSYLGNHKNIKKQKKDICIELMCHPGHPAEQYKHEVNMVTNKVLMQYADYKLISYNEL